jgi:hypothetical protein
MPRHYKNLPSLLRFVAAAAVLPLRAAQQRLLYIEVPQDDPALLSSDLLLQQLSLTECYS